MNSKVSEKSENSFTQAKSITQNSDEILSPVLIEPLENKMCTVGDYVTLECRISGGKGEPSWMFNSAAELPNGTVFRNFGELYRLRIRGLQEEQFGEYSIIVTGLKY